MSRPRTKLSTSLIRVCTSVMTSALLTVSATTAPRGLETIEATAGTSALACA
jgi:hypothetical protein